ncbi:MAG: Proline--tRNA ligase [Candidatus Methanophagaceae archaeon]|nr:MAG: Proline--tRNA ligase [Methanophagales archaeon]
MQTKTESKTTLPKEGHFSEWYSEILKRAEILDIRYPVKGVYVWYPYGFKLRNLIYTTLRAFMDKEHEEVLFPMLIPKDELMKEEEHIKGFEEEVFWVTKGGTTELDIPLALRPTSETAIYPVFKVWIRSHRDLPLRVYQIVNTFRYETKHTRPLIRLREITSFKEAHTAHASLTDAEEQVKIAIAIYQKFFDLLDVPYIITRRPDWDKFPGAVYTLAFDTLMPDGRTMQIGTIHLLGESFARTFDIKYEDNAGSLQYVNQTCYGISERCVAAVISIHGDEHGLVLPPEVSPIQVVIVPIVFSGKAGSNEDEVKKACAAVYEDLENAGIRAFLDDSEERPGAKYYRWEMKGVPLRIEIGPRDLRNNSCEFVRRDDFQRVHVPLHDAVPEVKRTLEEVQSGIYGRAKEALVANIYEREGSDAGTVEEMRALKNKAERGIVSLFLCDSARCGKDLEEHLDASVLGEPLNEDKMCDKSEGKCIICSRKARRVYVARTY